MPGHEQGVVSARRQERFFLPERALFSATRCACAKLWFAKAHEGSKRLCDWNHYPGCGHKKAQHAK